MTSAAASVVALGGVPVVMAETDADTDTGAGTDAIQVPDAVDALFREARALAARGDADGAARTWRRAMVPLEAQSPGHRALAEPLNELALWHAGRSELNEADALLARAERLLDGQREGEGAGRDLALAHVLASRARVSESLGGDADARRFNERALALYRVHEGEGASVWAAQSSVLNALAGLAHRRRRYREAEPLFIEALERLERAVGSDDPRLLPLLENLQTLYRSQGRADAEGRYGRRAEALRRKLASR